MVSRLLYKNTSPARIAGFILSNFLGLAIILGALQFWLDARSIWDSDDSFIHTDYMVINKRVTSSNTLGEAASFSKEEVADLEAQPWVRSVAPFSSADYRVMASLSQGGRGMSTYMFFESIPNGFVDVPASQWTWTEGSDEVPMIISKDYLSLYNFGFAGSAGLPQLSESLMSSIPITLTLSSEDGTRRMVMHGRVAGFSNRMNTILVPGNFMEWSNARLGSAAPAAPSRMIIDVSSPGDVAIDKYLAAHDYEKAGDKDSSASFFLRLVVGIVMAIGGVITLLSLFILMLSVSLLMEKNRDKLHSLLMLGYDLRAVGRPYAAIVSISSACALLLAFVGVLALRAAYIGPVRDLGANPAPLWVSAATGITLTLLIIFLNFVAIRRKVKSSWRL